MLTPRRMLLRNTAVPRCKDSFVILLVTRGPAKRMVSTTKAQLRWPCVDTQAGDTGYPAVGVSSGKKRKCNLQWLT